MQDVTRVTLTIDRQTAAILGDERMETMVGHTIQLTEEPDLTALVEDVEADGEDLRVTLAFQGEDARQVDSWAVQLS
jgi:hypothetical protein